MYILPGFKLLIYQDKIQDLKQAILYLHLYFNVCGNDETKISSKITLDTQITALVRVYR